MNDINAKAADTAARRVLVVGGSAAVLETVLAELSDCGIAAEGFVANEGPAGDFNAKTFDLIALGDGLCGRAGNAIRRDLAARNPGARLVDISAPSAVRQIIDAMEGADGRCAVDLDGYFARIGYDGPREAMLETLCLLHALHPSAIPFEAIDVLLERGVDIRPAAVDAKLIEARRGGYCYEQSGLFKRVLTELGFDVVGLTARVRWMAPPGAPARPRSHMALRVVLDGTPWLVDVGFGGLVATKPLRLDTVEPQTTEHETFRVFPYGDGHLVQASIGDKWMPLYEVSPEPQHDVDYEVPNWFTSSHPSSHFGRRLMVSRVTPAARYSLLDARFSVRRPDGRLDRQKLDADGIEDVLSSVFALPVEPSWRPMIERAAEAEEE